MSYFGVNYIGHTYVSMCGWCNNFTVSPITKGKTHMFFCILSKQIYMFYLSMWACECVGMCGRTQKFKIMY